MWQASSNKQFQSNNMKGKKLNPYFLLIKWGAIYCTILEFIITHRVEENGNK